MAGAGVAAWRRYIPLEAGRIYSARYLFQRAVKVSDPIGDGVICGVLWYNQDKVFIGSSEISSTSPTPGEGLRAASGTFAMSPGLATYTAPEDAVYCSPFFETFGSDGKTWLILAGVIDITNADTFAPSVDDLSSRVSALELLDVGDRLAELESAGVDPIVWGAKCDHREVADSAIDSGTVTLTSATASFTSDDIGKRVVVAKAGDLKSSAQRLELRATISAVNSATSVTLSTSAGATVSGAKCFIGTDDTAAIRTAAAFAVATGAPLYLGPRIYWWTNEDGNGGVTLAAGESLTVTGAHRDRTTLLHDAIDGAFIEGRGTASTADRAEGVSVRGVNFRGLHDFREYEVETSPISGDTPILRFQSINHLDVQDCSMRYVGGFGLIARNCIRVNVSNNRLERIANDGISVQQCDLWHITNNYIEYCDDDCIAMHAQPLFGATIAPRGGICMFNNIVGSQGIKGFGLRTAIIAHNNLKFCRASGIVVGAATGGGSANVTSHGIIIEGNVIENQLDRGAMTDDYLPSKWGIAVRSNAVDNGTAYGIPGDADSVAGGIVPIYDYLDYQSPAGGPVPPVSDIAVRNNMVVRTASGAEDYTTYGYGTYGRLWDDDYDPAITEAMLRIDGLQLGADCLHRIDVTGNTFSGIASGITFTQGEDTDAPLPFADIFIRGNRFIDLTDFAIEADVFNGAARWRVYLSDNLFDMDPYYTHADHADDGTWAADDSLRAIPIFLTTTTAWHFDNNLFRNCSRPFGLGEDAVSGSGNIVECHPVSIGDNASNAGVRQVPRPGDVWQIRFIECDTANASTFGQIINACPRASFSMPSSGKWLTGQYVQALTSGLSDAGTMLLGWKRLTTGSGHVEGTDWQPVYAATGSLNRVVLRASTGNLDDDEVLVVDTSYVVSGARTLHITASATGAYYTGVYRAGDGQATQIAAGGQLEIYTDSGGGALAGTTGTDGKLNVEFLADSIRIENRVGSTQFISVTLI